MVEPVVQRRIEQEIAPRLSNPGATGPAAGYFELWGADVYADARRGFFPFAAPYDDPARAPDDYRGTLGQLNGLLPVSTNTATWVNWSNVTVTPNPLSTGILGPMPPATCAPSGCTFQYTCTGACNFPDNGLDVTVTARLRNAANSLVLPTGITAGGDWLVTPGNPPVSVTRSFDTASGDLLVTLTFKLPPTAVPMTDADIPFPTPAFSALTAASGWFVANGWHRQTYYAISDGFSLLAPNLSSRPIDPLDVNYAGNPPCQPEPTAPACIRVDNGPAKARAVLVLAGRHLAGGTRTYTIGNYFELKNADVPSTTGAPVNQVFERRLRAGDFNDRVVVVSKEPPGP